MHKQGNTQLFYTRQLLDPVWDIKRQVEDAREDIYLLIVGNKVARLLKHITVRFTPLLPQKVLNKYIFLSDAIEVNMTEPINKNGLTQRSSSGKGSAGTPLVPLHARVM
jgi:hypothetical protein